MANLINDSVVNTLVLEITNLAPTECSERIPARDRVGMALVRAIETATTNKERYHVGRSFGIAYDIIMRTFTGSGRLSAIKLFETLEHRVLELIN